jgi:hypothetical protein
MFSSTNAKDATTAGGVAPTTISAGNASRSRKNFPCPRWSVLVGFIARVDDYLLGSVVVMSRPFVVDAINNFFQILLSKEMIRRDISQRPSIIAQPAMDALLAQSSRRPKDSLDAKQFAESVAIFK